MYLRRIRNNLVMPTDKLQGSLHDLIDACRDSERIYKAAADDASHSDLKALFRQYAAQRYRFLQELMAQLLQLGGQPDEIDLETDDDRQKQDAEWLAFCEEHEDDMLEAYDEVLKSTAFPEDTLNVLEHQFSAIKGSHEQIRHLRDTYRT